MAKPLPALIKDLKKANDDYHAAIDEILKSDDVIVEHKAIVGSSAEKIFRGMAKIMNLLKRIN